MSQNIDLSHEHDNIWLLIPWYANGRLGEQQRADVDAHLHTCQLCQDELFVQRKICLAMANSSPEIEQLPTASLRRLMQIIDGQEAMRDAHGDIITREVTLPAIATQPQSGTASRWPRALAASLVLLAALFSGFFVLSHGDLTNKTPPASYYTVTSPAPRIASEVIRAVFTPLITVAEMQAILNEAELSIVAGPTPAGVYSLAKTGTQTVDESLLHLRSHQQVLFAEPSTLTGTVASQ